MDTFFISHGGPPLVEDDSFAEHSFLKSWQSSVMQERPKAILMIGAHWDTDKPTVNLVHGANDTIYDYDGLPIEYHRYQVRNKKFMKSADIHVLTPHRPSNLL